MANDNAANDNAPVLTFFDGGSKGSNSLDECDSRLRQALYAFRRGFLSERALDAFVENGGRLPCSEEIEVGIIRCLLRPKESLE